MQSQGYTRWHSSDDLAFVITLLAPGVALALKAKKAAAQLKLAMLTMSLDPELNSSSTQRSTHPSCS